MVGEEGEQKKKIRKESREETVDRRSRRDIGEKKKKSRRKKGEIRNKSGEKTGKERREQRAESRE